MSQRDAHINVERRIAADPTSAVLLLAAPAAAELWPGVSLQAAEPGDHIKVRVSLPPAAAHLLGDDAPIDAVVRAEPPQRTPTSFVIRFSFEAETVPSTTGTLRLAHAPVDDDQVSATVAHVGFSVAAAYAEDNFLRALELSAQRFLDNLAAEAEARSHAA